MHINPEYPVGLCRFPPQGTNSTLFTECCKVAICSDEKCCPSCGREVVGSSIEDHHERAMYRWKIAYQGRIGGCDAE